MTTVAVMQPYLFPYIGYYQLVAAADIFVFLDDVNFIKRGFINRNWVMDRSGRPVPIRIPVRRASQNRRINELIYDPPGPKPLKTVRQCYSRSARFEEFYPLFDEVISQAEGHSVAEISALSITLVAKSLKLRTRFLTASEIDPQRTHGGQERILDICRHLGASRYINLPGGRNLYDADVFLGEGIQLSFLDTEVEPLTDEKGDKWHPSFLHYLLTEPGSRTRETLGKFRIHNA